jgi:hypothetical protein
MLSLDQARAGGEGMLSSPKKKEEEDMTEGPDLFQSREQKVKITVPEGWHSKEP